MLRGLSLLGYGLIMGRADLNNNKRIEVTIIDASMTSWRRDVVEEEKVKGEDKQVWQILDVGSIWMKEFASALASIEPTVAWCPQMENFGMVQNWQRDERLADPPLPITYFPLQRGYAR